MVIFRHHNVFIIIGCVLHNCPNQGFFDESQKKNRNKGRKINSYRHWRKYLLNGPDNGIGDTVNPLDDLTTGINIKP